MKKSLTVTAVAAVLALSGCGNQTLVGPGAIDPTHEPVGAEQAREVADEVHKEIAAGGGGGSGH